MGTVTKNVVVFGESGSGKSSLVNLVLGKDEARVSDKAVGCTFNFHKYETENFNLYDTVGLSEGSAGTLKQPQAIRQLSTLIKSLEDGVSLLIFVIEKGRIKQSLENNYKLFIDVICTKKVPVVLAITHCEMENDRGSWWIENKHHFDNYGMTFDAVVSGSALNPESVSKIMQPAIKEINALTAREILQAINFNLLTTSWKFEGGWRGWFLNILSGLTMFVVRGLSPGRIVGSTIEQRLLSYFQSQGYSLAESVTMAREIAYDLA